MPWLRHFALVFVFVAALLRPATAGAFVWAPDANAQARVGAFELAAATLVGPASGATCGLHEGIGAAHDGNASGYRFAARGAARAVHPAMELPGAANTINHIFGKSAHQLEGLVTHFGSREAAYTDAPGERAEDGDGIHPERFPAAAPMSQKHKLAAHARPQDRPRGSAGTSAQPRLPAADGAAGVRWR